MTKKRVTITIKKDLLEKLDNFIDGDDIRNRSHAVEHIISKSFEKNGIDTAVIMAGGEGTRLRPITYEIPKPLIPIHGKPMLEHQINMLKNNGIMDVILCVGYKNEKIREYFGDGSRFGVNIKYVVEDRPLGTAGPLRLIKKILKKTFVVINVDTLMNPEIGMIYDFHKKNNALITILLVTVDDPSSYGVVSLRGNQIIDFVEKPKKNAPSNLINAGLMVFEPEAIKFISKNKYMLEDLYKRVLKTNKIFGYPHDKKVYDVGTHERYEKAIKEWKDIV